MSDGDGRAAVGEQAAHISREMVRLMRRIAGRGPTKARTTIGRDHVLVMLQENLTEGERNLVRSGMSDRVEAMRSGYQELLRNEATTMIETTLDRTVVGFMSANHFEPDLAAEVFVLDPSDEPQTPTPQEAEHSDGR